MLMLTMLSWLIAWVYGMRLQKLTKILLSPKAKKWEWEYGMAFPFLMRVISFPIWFPYFWLIMSHSCEIPAVSYPMRVSITNSNAHSVWTYLKLFAQFCIVSHNSKSCWYKWCSDCWPMSYLFEWQWSFDCFSTVM